MLTVEIHASQMPNYAGHGHLTAAPGATKIELKLIILDILVATDGYLFLLSVWGFHKDRRKRLTVCMEPPDMCWATDLAMAGFSATHNILGAMVRGL